MKGSRLDQLEAVNPEKAAIVRKGLEKSTLRRELTAMSKDAVIEYAAEHDIEIDPEESKKKIIKAILRATYGKPVEEEAAYPDGDPSMSWTKAELMAYADAHEIEYETSWTKQEILDAIEAE